MASDHGVITLTIRDGSIIDIGDVRILVTKNPKRNKQLRLHIRAPLVVPVSRHAPLPECTDKFDKAQTSKKGKHATGDALQTKS